MLRPGWGVIVWGLGLCGMLEFSKCGDTAWQPQRTEPCQCMNGLPWAYHGPLQGQMQSSPNYAAGVVEPTLGDVYEGCCFADCLLEFSRCGGTACRQPQCTEPCQCVGGQPWACHGQLQGQMHPLQHAVGVIEPDLGAAARLGSWYLGGSGFSECCCSFPDGEALLNNHSAQSPASV